MVDYSEVVLVIALFSTGLILLLVLWKLKNPHQSVLYVPGLPRMFSSRFHREVLPLNRDELDSRFRQETGLTGVYSEREKRRRLSRIYEQRDRARLRGLNQNFQSDKDPISRMGLPKVDKDAMEMSRISITWKRMNEAPGIFPKLLGNSLQASSTTDRFKRIAKSTADHTIGTVQEVRKTEEYRRLLNVSSAKAAEGSSRIILDEFNQSSREDQVRMKRMVYLASKSAAVGSRSERVSPETRTKLADIAKVYQETHREMRVRPK